ncbi:MAG: GNAT family N-acetyltransferase [Caulobacteraceae bacterium]
MGFEIVPADGPPRDLRERYFETLGEPQVHYLEQRVARARAFVFGPAASPVGYQAIHDGAVVEFFVVDAALPSLSELFYAAAEQGGATCAVVKSYDPLALAAAAGRPTRATTIGVNCTTWTDERFEPPNGFAARPGRADDLAVLRAIGPGLWERPDEMSSDLQAGRITIYEQDGAPVGCGVLSPVREGADALDIGVGVLPDWRRKGVGEQIVRHLKVVSLRERHMRPVCGCAVENIGSRRTLERAGFLTRHRLLELSWQDP